MILGSQNPERKKGSKKNNLDDDVNNDENMISKIAKSIAKDLPGYTESNNIDDSDAVDKTRLLDKGYSRRRITEVNSVDLCSKVTDWINEQSKDAGTNRSSGKVTSNTVKEYNQRLVDNHEDNNDILVKLLQHERLYEMMKTNKISRDRSLWDYLDHYADERSVRIQQLSPLVRTGHRLEGVTDCNCNHDFLNSYFSDNQS